MTRLRISVVFCTLFISFCTIKLLLLSSANGILSFILTVIHLCSILWDHLFLLSHVRPCENGTNHRDCSWVEKFLNSSENDSSVCYIIMPLQGSWYVVNDNWSTLKKWCFTISHIDFPCQLLTSTSTVPVSLWVKHAFSRALFFWVPMTPHAWC